MIALARKALQWSFASGSTVYRQCLPPCRFLGTSRELAFSQRRISLQSANHRLLSTSIQLQRSSPSTQSPGDSTQTGLVRRLMRLVPHPVAVITATDPSASTSGDVSQGWRGATVSSFNTVTMTPFPIVSFNIKRQSATFTAIENAGAFNVHLLNGTPQAEDIATKFASGNASAPFHDEDGQVARFAKQDAEAKDAPPIIQAETSAGKGDAVTAFRFRCDYMSDKTVEIGDHVVVFGEVSAVEDPETQSVTQGSDPRPCLVYVDRRYCRVS
jgi:flavin reductase (DIM6/NTAB) family NADH-FMN oxidoreductase RutF